MRVTILILLLLNLFITSCNKQNTSIDITAFNGYWEIDKVITSSGKETNYGFNEYVDFFNTKDSLGFRNKVKPQFGGKYLSNNQQINYRINTKNDSVFLTYQNAFTSWSDYVISANNKQICIQNKEGISYYYRPYTPIIIDEEEN